MYNKREGEDFKMINKLIEKIKGKDITIVFPEGDDPRVIEAAKRLVADGVLRPILLTDSPVDGVDTVDIKNDVNRDSLVEKALKARKGKWDLEKTEKLLGMTNYYGTMMVKAGLADGLVGGATYSTADTVRPALQLVKTKPGASIVSSALLMIKDGEQLMFGDCAINPDPNAEQLAEIAIQSAETARVFGLEPRVGLLSFSTNGSASHDNVTKVQEAKKILDNSNVTFEYEGEIQFDAAYVPAIGEKKFPGSKVAGRVNTFVFPDLQSGNIGYKIAERLGGYEALGPVLQGLNAPINDLSRGCSADDIYKLAIITASQTLS